MSLKTDTTKPYKAIAAFVLTFLGLLVQAIVNAGNGIGWKEWLVIVVGTLVTTGATYGITNTPKDSLE